MQLGKTTCANKYRVLPMHSLKRKFKFGLALLSFTAIPDLAHADFCDLLVGGGAPACRVNASNMGATIIGNWLRLKPETAVKGSTGRKGKFSSAAVPAYGVLGVKPQSRLTMTVDCFAGDRTMRITALPYMLGLTNGKIHHSILHSRLIKSRHLKRLGLCVGKVQSWRHLAVADCSAN